MLNIPIVDFQNFLIGNQAEKQAVADELTSAFRTHGFAYLKNYGISNESTRKIFDYSKKFFDSDLEVKESAKKNPLFFTGYDNVGKEKLSNRPADLKESYMVKQFDTPWPTVTDDLVGFKEELLKFHEECRSLALKILGSIAISFGLDEAHFEEKFDGECQVLRLLHYPPTLETLEENQLRCGEHTDYGSVTVLFQDPVGGLQVKHKEGSWIPAPYIEDTIVINVGDMMEMWTNGYLKSTPHRVVNPEGDMKLKSRYSTAFFNDPCLSCEAKPLQKFKDTKNTTLCAKTYKDHVYNKFINSYPGSKFNNLA